MRKLPYEIMAEANKGETAEEVAQTLRKYADNIYLKEYLYMNFSKHEWNLPEGTPPYKESTVPVGMADTNLYKELRRVRGFIKGAPGEYVNVPAMQRETIFIGILEGIEKDEAKFLTNVKDKTLTTLYPNVTLEAIQAAYPEFKV